MDWVLDDTKKLLLILLRVITSSLYFLKPLLLEIHTEIFTGKTTECLIF